MKKFVKVVLVLLAISSVFILSFYYSDTHQVDSTESSSKSSDHTLSLSKGTEHSLPDMSENSLSLSEDIDHSLSDSKDHSVSDSKDHSLSEGSDHSLPDSRAHSLGLSEGIDSSLSESHEHSFSEGNVPGLPDRSDHNLSMSTSIDRSISDSSDHSFSEGSVTSLPYSSDHNLSMSTSIDHTISDSRDHSLSEGSVTSLPYSSDHNLSRMDRSISEDTNQVQCSDLAVLKDSESWGTKEQGSTWRLNELSCLNKQSYFEGLSLEFRFAAFYPLKKKARHIYDTFLPALELELDAKLNCWCDAWFDIGYVWDTGRSIGLDSKTDLRLLPMSLGLKFMLPVLSCVDAYLGLGVSYSLLGIHDHSPYVHEHMHKNAFGALFKAGLNYKFNDCIYFDGFFEYYYQHFHFHQKINPDKVVYVQHLLDLSALKFGIGVGYAF